jgi:hypothetical protein
MSCIWKCDISKPVGTLSGLDGGGGEANFVLRNFKLKFNFYSSNAEVLILMVFSFDREDYWML